MLIVWVLRILSLVALLGGLGLLGSLLYAKFNSYEPREVKRGAFLLPVVLFLGGLLFLFWTMAATYVPATHMAVVENTATGSIKVIGPGIHIWPFQANLVPLTSKVTQYNMRNQQIEIGTEKDSPGIAAGSNSPGNPVVYIKARAWAAPDPKNLATLHRLYGPGYLDNWVERNLVETSKSVQGQHPYDFLIANRDKMATEVETNVQGSLTSGEKRLAVVTQLAITDFDFTAQINKQLDEVAQKEFDRQKAEKDALIATQQQAAENIKAETRLQVARKDGETTIAAATAEAEAIRLKYGGDPNAYIQRQWVEKWNGQLPTVSSGDGGGIILQMPAPAAPAKG